MADANEQLVAIPADGKTLRGFLNIPEGAGGLVVFAHGSGSSSISPRNSFVAREIQQEGLGTLLFDLLTEKEDENYQARFDIDLLVARLGQALDWIKSDRNLKKLSIGLFGSSTGASAALRVAALKESGITAVVSRGGRTDLADSVLSEISAPTLFIVGESDEEVLELNRSSFNLLACQKELSVIEGATHLFEEPGTLEQVAKLAARWFKRHLS